jgi:hypothetical protein
VRLPGAPGIHRQWTELAYWYPARSGPVGNSDYGTIFTASNNADSLDLTVEGKLKTGTCSDQKTFTDSLSGLGQLTTTLGNHIETHGFMLVKPLFEVWPAYKKYLGRLGDADPDGGSTK